MEGIWSTPICLAVINVITFIVFGLDKLKARKNLWRIPEATLMCLALLGGSIGAYIGMRVWHHKTRHKKFQYGIPAIMAVQLVLAVWLATRTI